MYKTLGIGIGGGGGGFLLANILNFDQIPQIEVFVVQCLISIVLLLLGSLCWNRAYTVMYKMDVVLADQEKNDDRTL